MQSWRASWLYWPPVLVLGAAAPLVAYLTVEFLGAPAWPVDGAVLGPVVSLLGGGP